MVKALFAGSFDPFTNGHLDIVTRSSRLFSEVTILIAQNASKKNVFTAEERYALIQASVEHLPNVDVDILEDGLTVHYAKEKGIDVMIRGLRNATDLDYEWAIALANRSQDEAIETMSFFSNPEHSYVSSTIVRDVASNHGDLQDLVPEPFIQGLHEKYHYSNGDNGE